MALQIVTWAMLLIFQIIFSGSQVPVKQNNSNPILFATFVTTLLETLVVEHSNTQSSPTSALCCWDKILLFLSLWVVMF
jgi:hypothetical protein